MEKRVLEAATDWAENNSFDQGFRDEICRLIDQNDEAELTDRFYKDLEFGTGGMRGVIGAGSNRMNVYTIRRATQGLADYINRDASGEHSVAIAYDNRRFSPEYTLEAARVLAGNGIRVFLFPSLCPTPILSFTVRRLQATAGIVITASHNPPEYNGYKVYWSDGGQITPPRDREIIDCVKSIQDFSTIKLTSADDGLIGRVPDGVELDYYDKVETLSSGGKGPNRNFGVVYTPLHGTGNVPVREALKRRGFERVIVVPEQEKPDPDFSTVEFPNPEEESALKLAIQTAGPEDRLILATDPDADRVGAMARVGENWVKLNGNQIGQLLVYSRLDGLKKTGGLPARGFYVSTIVTSDLGRKIAEGFGLTCRETLTGFKWIAEIVQNLEEKGEGEFVFGCEESHGYLLGDFCRDKDAVSACVIFAEMAAKLAEENRTPFDLLNDIHQKFGYHRDSLITKTIKGQAGAETIGNIMRFLRESPPKTLGGVRVVTVKDYQEDSVYDATNETRTGSTGLPKSNVLAFYLEDGGRITARPSGTEPKIKFYFNLCGGDDEILSQKLSVFEADLTALINQVK